MKRFIFMLTIMILSGTVFAQNMKVEGMKKTSEALASINKWTDGEPNALVRVFMVAEKATFSNTSLAGYKKHSDNEFWVYMDEGASKLTVRVDGFTPITVKFSDYGISRLEKLVTYDLRIDVPRLSRSNELQTVVFTVVPSSAKLMIDNREYTVTNGTFRYDLGAGKHNFTLEADYYHPYTGEFLLDRKSETKDVKVEMKRKVVGLSVSTAPAGADVYIDSKKVGTTPIADYQMPAGRHELTIQKKNYKTVLHSFEAKGDEPVSFSETMNQFIPITITSNTKADIKLDGEDLGVLPVTIERPSGDYNVELHKWGYHDKNTTLNVDGSKSEYKLNMMKRYFYPTDFYLSADFGVGHMMTVGASLGFYVSNFNIEGSFGFGLDKRDKIYWLVDDTKKSAYLSSNSPMEYNAFNMGLKIGYGLLLGNHIRLTPQVGFNYTTFQDATSKKSSSNKEMTSVLKGCVGARFEVAVAENFNIAVTPEYNFNMANGKPYASMAKVSEPIDKAGKGFRLVCSLVYNINVND